MNDDDAEPKLAAPAAEDDPAGHDGARSEALPTVAIGSSAGGLRALQELFNALPPDLGAAFVVVSHLDPSHPSELVSILRRRTGMPVNEVGEFDAAGAQSRLRHRSRPAVAHRRA